METGQWEELLNELDTTALGRFFFPSEGRTRLRLVAPEGREVTEFYTETTRVYQGKERTRFLFLGVIFGADDREIPEDMSQKATPLVTAKTVMKGILSLLAEGYDLFGEEAHGITIVRSGQGLDTSYNVIPSPKPIPLPDDIEFPEESLEELSNEYYQSSLERDSDRNSGSSGGGSGSSGGGDSTDW